MIIVRKDRRQRTGHEREDGNTENHNNDAVHALVVVCRCNVAVTHSGDCSNGEVERFEVNFFALKLKLQLFEL